jgi:hypothetical protein
MAAAPAASPREAGKEAFRRGDFTAAVRARSVGRRRER